MLTRNEVTGLVCSLLGGIARICDFDEIEAALIELAEPHSIDTLRELFSAMAKVKVIEKPDSTLASETDDGEDSDDKGFIQ